ncbi:DUF3011 domain-containing protein [Dyella solisilvae]|uniref:DUF3011 domain-containing protein n=2 Tax=Dyella solisilvae TaxID=1920168 RepID=A0A370KCE1_9GAMM|nr:DUF3011 domain-containing protein [Dyella solisilvae]
MRASSLGLLAGLMAGFLWVEPAPVLAQGRDMIRCGSADGRFTRCQVPWRDAEIIRQESNSPCTRGQTWGVDRGGLWVDRGCRGQFVEMGRGGWGGGRRDDDDDGRWQGGGWRPGPDWDREIRFQCESNDERYQFCQVDVGGRGRVRLLRQLSGRACEEDYSWGWNRAGVWVAKGCRGLFSVDRRW